MSLGVIELIPSIWATVLVGVILFKLSTSAPSTKSSLIVASLTVSFTNFSLI